MSRPVLVDVSAHGSARLRKLPVRVDDPFHDGEKFERRSRRPVEASDKQRVTGGKPADRNARAAGRFPETLSGTGGAQLLDLRVTAPSVVDTRA